MIKPARISLKEISGASGGFLPKPLLLRLRLPNSKKISRVFCEILSPKNCFRKTEPALVQFPLEKGSRKVYNYSTKTIYCFCAEDLKGGAIFCQ